MSNWRQRLTPRFIAFAIPTTVVAGVAAYNSYWHQVLVATWGYQPVALAHTLPLSVDGMLLVATAAMVVDKAEGRKPRGWARIAFWLGATVSIAANVASVLVEHGLNPLAIGVASWSPVALLVVVEVLSRPGKLISAEKNPVRVEAGKKAAVTRSRKTTSKPATARKPRVKTPVAAIEALTDVAPTSPAPIER
jgi:hypothetical protein